MVCNTIRLTVWSTDSIGVGIIISDGEIGVTTTKQLAYTGIKVCPQPSVLFTGRDRPVQRAAEYLLGEVTKRRVLVIHGLGGAGKTQLALRIVEKTREHWSDVVYADATSVETINATLKAFADLKGIGNTYQHTLQWLESKEGRWLLVLDNADDPNVDILTYIPDNLHGSILITTRNRDLLLLAHEPESKCKISSMEPEEALQLLVKASCLEDSNLPQDDQNAAKALLEVSCGFPATTYMLECFLEPRVPTTCDSSSRWIHPPDPV